MGTHKLTIRLDDEVWTDLQRVCDVNGVSITGFMQACAIASVRDHAEHDWRPLDTWDDYPEYARIVADARQIDARRRGRSRTDEA